MHGVEVPKHGLEEEQRRVALCSQRRELHVEACERSVYLATIGHWRSRHHRLVDVIVAVRRVAVGGKYGGLVIGRCVHGRLVPSLPQPQRLDAEHICVRSIWPYVKLNSMAVLLIW